MKKLASRNLELSSEKAKVLLREIPLLVLECVKDGDNLLGVPAISIENGFKSGLVHVASPVPLGFARLG